MAKQEYRSVCRVCHGGCGALLTVDGDRLTKVRPDPACPINIGRMCPKGPATPAIMYHPARLLTPLKRDGERGSNNWRPIDWDTALTEIACKLADIRQQTGPETIAIGQGTGRHHYMHVIRFANQLGTPNWYEPGLANCFIPRVTVSRLTYGGFVTADYYGTKDPSTILFWGHNPLVTGADGELSFPAARALERGAFGIAIDPRRSETARRCRMWLPIRPGTDAALALSMIHVIIAHDAQDESFVNESTTGFTELKEHVAEHTSSWAESVTGIPAADIEAAALRYAREKPGILEWGVAIEQTPNSLQNVRAIALLRAITGNIDIPGGDIIGMNIARPYPVLRELLPRSAAKKRLGADEFKLLSGPRALMPSAHIPALFRAMRTGDPYRVRAMMLFGGNPLVTVADPRSVRESLLKLELLVATDLFMTPSTALADYVLPAALWPEVDQVVALPYASENAVLAQQRVIRTGNCRQDEDIMIDLARRLNLPGSDDTLDDLLDHRLEPLNMTFAELKQRGIVFPEHEYEKFKSTGFRTPSKKVELYSKSLAKLGYDPMPTYKEPPESPISRPDLATRFPYVLTTGARRIEFFHSEHRQIDQLRKKRPFPVAELHPATAHRHGIADGDWIKVISPRDTIRMKAVVTEDIVSGVINIDHGWWFPERKAPDYGVWESNANLLTSAAAPYDPAFGSYQLRGLLCTVEREESSSSEEIVPDHRTDRRIPEEIA